MRSPARLTRSLRAVADARWARHRARSILAPSPARLRRLPDAVDTAAAPEVTVYVASWNTQDSTELCVQSLLDLAGHPFSLVVGDSSSTDGSAEMLRSFEARGLLTLEVAPERRLHSEWLDRWRASCETPLAVFVDSDVEALRSGWLRLLVAAWQSTHAAVVCAEYLDDLRRFVEPVGGEVVRAAPRPAPWLMLVDVDQTRSVDASFAFDKEWTRVFPECLVYDVGARFYEAVRAQGLSAVEMAAPYASFYRHYGGRSWRGDERVDARGGNRNAADVFRLPFRRRTNGSTAPPVDEYREYVGGLWDEVGKLQFEFMVARGLRPEHVLLDVACGSLRGGVHFISYLDPGNYLGIDLEQKLIDLGLERELGPALAAEKRPEFVVSGRFEFDRFSKRPDVSLAQSLFSHLVIEDMRLCLTQLRAFVAPGHSFYATFNEGTSAANPAQSDSHGYFAYSVDELSSLARATGWDADYIGEWGHPRGQKMMRFEAA